MKIIGCCVIGMLSWALGACENDSKNEFTKQEIQTIRAVMSKYREAWLRSDSSQVLNALSDSIILFVPGNDIPRVIGKKEVRKFWFPPSDITYPVTKYEITGEQVMGAGRFAIIQGHSLLEWKTVKGDSLLKTNSVSSDYMSVLKRENGSWKIFRQMYQVKNN